MSPQTCGSALLLAALCSLSPAQCDPQLLAGSPLPGVDGQVRAMAWWDAPGAPTSRLILAGSFSRMVDQRTSGLGLYDPMSDSWSPLADVEGAVLDVRVTASGGLVIAGDFSSVDGVAASNVAQFDGSGWSALGAGLPGEVNAIQELPNGDIVATGAFVNAGPQQAGGIARFDGTSWQSMGTLNIGGFLSGEGEDLALAANGDLIVAGRFDRIGTQPLGCVARWDGTDWYPFGAGISNALFNPGMALAVLPSGNLILGGAFDNIDGISAEGLAEWDGTTWREIGGGPGFVDALHVLDNGNVVVGAFSDWNFGSGVVNGVAIWNGLSLDPVGVAGPRSLSAFAELPNGDLFAGGALTEHGTPVTTGLARWDGLSWSAVADGSDGTVAVALTLPGGRAFVGGRFSAIAGVDALNAAYFDGATWQPRSMAFSAQSVAAAAESPAGELFVATNNTPEVFRWDGSAWQSIGYFGGAIKQLAFSPAGNLVAAGDFTSIAGESLRGVAQWDGSSWNDVVPGFVGTVNAVTWMLDGRVVLGGDLNNSGGFIGTIAAFQGSVFDNLDGGFDVAPYALDVAPNGDLLAGGRFQLAGGQPARSVARWNGQSWEALGTGVGAVGDPGERVFCLTVLPDGQVLVGGRFSVAGGQPAANLARWDGLAWNAIGEGADDEVLSVASTRDGRVTAGGRFLRVDGAVSSVVARFQPTCEASTIAYGAGCSQPGSTPTLTIDNDAWVGGTLVSTVDDLPALGLAVAIYGAQPQSLLLAPLLPEAAPGCLLLASPDVVTWELAFGASRHELPIPASQAVIGLTLHHQVLSFAIGAGGIASIAGTDGNALSIGSLW